MKNILILGAGPDQLPMYKAAKKNGLYIIGADANAKSYSRGHADTFLHLQSRAAKEIISKMKDKPLHGVISVATDAFVETIFDLSQHYKLPNASTLEAVKAATDKAYFNNILIKLGLNTRRFLKSEYIEELKEFALDEGFPLMVKPTDSCGNKGVSYVALEKEMDSAIHKAMEVSFAKQVIVESYLNGDHFGVETFRYNGKTKLLAISKRTHTSTPYFTTLQHFMGMTIPESIEQRVFRDIDLICNYLKIEHGPVNFDYILKGNRIYLLEMGLRLAGNGLPDLVNMSYGLDPYDTALNIAIGNEIDESIFNKESIRRAALRLIVSWENGILDHIEGLDLLKAHPAFVHVNVFAKKGDIINKFSKANDRLGNILVAHEDGDLVNDALQLIDNKIRISLVSKLGN